MSFFFLYLICLKLQRTFRSFLEVSSFEQGTLGMLRLDVAKGQRGVGRSTSPNGGSELRFGLAVVAGMGNGLLGGAKEWFKHHLCKGRIIMNDNQWLKHV